MVCPYLCSVPDCLNKFFPEFPCHFKLRHSNEHVSVFEEAFLICFQLLRVRSFIRTFRIKQKQDILAHVIKPPFYSALQLCNFPSVTSCSSWSCLCGLNMGTLRPVSSLLSFLNGRKYVEIAFLSVYLYLLSTFLNHVVDFYEIQ